MKRREPPHLATWMLRHLTAGYRDEALDGDLLEDFVLGRSNAWYWRQVSVTCVHSWRSNVCARGPVLVFALLWSMFSPAWYTIIDSIESSSVIDRGSELFEPFWLPLILVGWMVIHTIYFLAGSLLYRFLHSILQKPIRQQVLKRSFWIAALTFPWISGVTFMIANLYWYSIPGLSQARLPSNFAGQVSDLSLLADFIRFPYFVAMLIALWGTVHEIRNDDMDESFYRFDDKRDVKFR